MPTVNAEHIATGAAKSAEEVRTERSFASDVFKLGTGTLAAQILGGLTAPLLTRLFSPQAFGITTLFTSITSVIGVIVCLRYEQSIILPAKDEDGANSLALFLCFVVLTTFL